MPSLNVGTRKVIPGFQVVTWEVALLWEELLPGHFLLDSLPPSEHATRAQSDSSVISWSIVRQAPPSMEFSRQEYWSGLPFPPPGDRPDPRIKHMSLASLALAGGFFHTGAIWEAPLSDRAALLFSELHKGLTKDWGHLEVRRILTPAGQPRFGPADEFCSLLGSPLKPSDSQTAWNSHEFLNWLCFLTLPPSFKWCRKARGAAVGEISFPQVRQDCGKLLLLQWLYCIAHVYNILCTSNLHNSLCQLYPNLKKQVCLLETRPLDFFYFYFFHLFLLAGG